MVLNQKLTSVIKHVPAIGTIPPTCERSIHGGGIITYHLIYYYRNKKGVQQQQLKKGSVLKRISAGLFSIGSGIIRLRSYEFLSKAI